MGLWSAIVAAFLGAAFAQAGTTLRVAPNVRQFGRFGGECQSTVIAPGVKPQCPNGRVFLSDDLWINSQGTNFPPATGTVRGIDLKDGTAVDATFDIPTGPKDSPTDPKYWDFVGNDHDLVSLANGDLLLCIANLTRAPLLVKPPWFDVTYDGSFGPGARTAIFIWRSTDGGQTFHFVSVFDSGQVEGGLAGLPQSSRVTTPPGSPSRPVFKMGGTDGPLFYVDKTSGQIFLTHLISGNLQDTSVTDHFELSQTPVYQTLVALSWDEGSSWNVLGSFPGGWWRLPLVRWSDGTLALASLAPGSPALTFVTGPYVLPGVGISYVFKEDQNNPIAPGLKFKWDLQTFFQNPKLADPTTGTLYYVYAHNWAPLEMAPAGTSDVAVIGVPATIPGFFEAGHGYRVFLYTRNGSQPWSEIPAVLAENATYNTFVLHLTIIPGHGGPALLYWTEFNADTNRSTVRGRLVSEDGWYSSDFSISLINGAPMTWSIDPHTAPPWYGDYQTADSYSRIIGTGSIALRSVEYHYFPMWVQPDESLHFTEVTFSEPFIHGLMPTPNYVSNQSIRYYPIHADHFSTSTLFLEDLSPGRDLRETPKIFGSLGASGDEEP